MRVTKFTHSCLRIEGDGVLVVDPGVFSEVTALDGADAVLLTHEHPDHVNLEALVARPHLQVYAHPDVLATLDGFDGAMTAVDPGLEFTAAGFEVSAHGGRHAVIHPDIPRIANVSYLVSDGDANLYHPGDSFDLPSGAVVDTLFVPLNAPWMRLAESIDFVRAVKPGRAYALHDSLLTEAGAKISDGHLERLSGTTYAHVAPGTVIS